MCYMVVRPDDSTLLRIANNARMTVKHELLGLKSKSLQRNTDGRTRGSSKYEAGNSESGLHVSPSSRPRYTNYAGAERRDGTRNGDPCRIPTLDEFHCVTPVLAPQSKHPPNPLIVLRQLRRIAVRIHHFLEDEVVQRHHSRTSRRRVLALILQLDRGSARAIKDQRETGAFH